MTEPALLMLLGRLLSPIPRVRWEVARSLAWLIRGGKREASKALLGWIRARRLESEVILGLGVIDAFRLGPYFDFSDLKTAVRAPSLLSDYLLRQNFDGVTGLSVFRYDVSPGHDATLSQEEATWFDRYRRVAVPGIFSATLADLETRTGFDFMARWEHDWRWLQMTHPRPQVQFPSFFTKGDRGRTGQFMVGQTELYVSAYLRTLAFAFIHGWTSEEVADQSAMLALTINRGLADLEPIDRPEWARSLLPWDAARTRECVERLWKHANTLTTAREVPVALRAVDVAPGGFVEIDVTLAVGARGLSAMPAVAEAQNICFVGWDSTGVAGPVVRSGNATVFSRGGPHILVRQVVPGHFGRVHSDMILDVRLVSPDFFGTTVEIECTPTDMRVVAEDEVLSRWMHWYADWEPTKLKEMSSFVGSISTVSESVLDDFRTRQNMDVARLVTVRRGMRPEVWGEVDVEEETFWL